MPHFQRNNRDFTPSGGNYLVQTVGQNPTTFNPGSYDTVHLEAALSAMAARGFNTVRLWYWPTNAGLQGGTGLDQTYATNVADAIKRAYAHNIVVVLSCAGLPNYGGYAPDPAIDATLYGGYDKQNWIYLTADSLSARNHFLGDQLRALVQRGVTADMLLTVELSGEIAFFENTYPFSLTTGMIVTKTGTYNMASAVSRAACRDDNIVAYINSQVATIKAIYPTVPANVQIAPEANNPQPGVAIYPNVAIITRTTVDALILSLYPTFDRPLSTLMSSFGVSLPMPQIVMQETGWLQSHTGTTAQHAALSQAWISNACNYGVYGFLWFMWDLSAVNSSGYVPMVGDAVAGNIFADALNPLQIGDGCGGGLTLAPVTAGQRATLRCYAPGVYPEVVVNGYPGQPVAVIKDVLAWRATMTAVNQFPGHRLELPETARNVLMALPAFSTIDIEQAGLGVVARGLVTAPEQQVSADYEGRIILDLPNITDQGLEVSTGMGYVDAQAIGQVVANLGALGTKGEDILLNYDAQGYAVETVLPGRVTGWSARYVDDGTTLSASAPVAWTILGNAAANGNSVARLANTGSGYGVASGGSGMPTHVNIAAPCQFQWQIVVPNICQVGLRADHTIGSPDWGFDFSNPTTGAGGVLQGTWQVLAGRAGVAGASGTYVGNTSFAVAVVPSVLGGVVMQFFVAGLLVYQSPLAVYGPLTPVAYISSAQGEVGNAIFTRTVPASQAWYQVLYDKQTQVGALLQLAQDTGMFVRQGIDAASGAPTRSYEFGPMNAASTVSLIDGRGGDLNRLRANSNIRIIKDVTAYRVDSNSVYTVTTPLGGGNGPAQVSVELLWRILNDPTFADYAPKRGGVANVFPEYDPAFTIHRTGRNGAKEYYIVYEPAFGPAGYAAWSAGGALPLGALGYKEGGPAADSQIVYPEQASLAQQEGAQRLLYKACIERMKRAVVPHITITLTTVGDWLPPRAGDRVHIDYTQVATDKLGPWAPLHIYTGGTPGFHNSADPTNPDPRVLSVTRDMSGDGMPQDTWVISNLGKYPDTPQATAAGQLKTIAALQITTQTGVNVTHLNPAFSEIDAAHPVVLPFYILPTTFRVAAFYLLVNFFPFRQTTTNTSSLLYNAQGTPIMTVGSVNVVIPATTDVGIDSTHTAQDAPIAAMPKHFHHTIVSSASNGAPTAGTGYLFIGLQGTGLLANNASGNFATSTQIETPDLAPTNHQHTVPVKSTARAAGAQIGHIPAGTTLGPLPQHYHPTPADIAEEASPSGISVEIDSGDGVFVQRTAQLFDAISNAPGTANGFTGPFRVEISRFVNAPGKLVNIRLSSFGNATNGRGRISWGGTVMEEIGGLGSIINASQ